MRTQVYFRDVAGLSVVKTDGSNLFPNVAIAAGRNETERSFEALSVLMNCPHIDSVVVIRDAIDSNAIPLSSLGRICVGQKMKIDADPVKILESVENSDQVVLTHLRQRRALSSQDEQSYLLDVRTVSEFFRSKVSSSLPKGDYSAIETTMTYYPSFGKGSLSSSFVNCHIDDEGTFDVRRVDCQLGSGTVLFNASDFKIEANYKDGRARFLPVMISDTVRCLVLPEGASVFIREPSERMLKEGKMPSVHAHGIGPEDGSSERRITFKHDLVL